MDTINTLGRRKTSVARIYLTEGEGRIIVNDKEAVDYFKTIELRNKVNQPFKVTGTDGKYDVVINVYGGGTNGQAEASRLAIARALVEIQEEWKSKLRAEGLLTRDPRMVERKKFGQKKARKRFQFSKR